MYIKKSGMLLWVKHCEREDGNERNRYAVVVTV